MQALRLDIGRFAGLGKTAQVIALLAHLKEVKAKGPHLVIVPSSTLDNWLREFSVFAPSLEVRSYYGSQGERVGLRHEMKEEKDTIDVVVTTYNMATGAPDDRKFLRKMEFKVSPSAVVSISQGNERGLIVSPYDGS